MTLFVRTALERISVVRCALLGAACWTLGACTESAREPVVAELRARGGPATVALADGTQVILSRADIAFGPLYLCAGAQAGQTCATALAEWREAAVVDVLDDAPVSLGTLEGYSGRALSFMHDLGIVSLLTQEEPLVLPAAEALGGQSVELEGTAEVEGMPVVPFVVRLVLASSQAADRGQPVVRSSPGQFDAELTVATEAITVAFDASAWLSGLDASAFWQDAACGEETAGTLCAGTVSQDCGTGESTDCAAEEQICAPNRGCQPAVVLDDDSAAGRSVAQAITLSAGLELEVE